MSYPRKRGTKDYGSYVLRQDSLKVTTPNVTLEVNCPRGLDLGTARDPITIVSGIEFTLAKDVAGGKAYASAGFQITRDSRLPNNVMEFRNDAEQVVGRVINVGRISPTEDDDDEED